MRSLFQEHFDIITKKLKKEKKKAETNRKKRKGVIFEGL